MVMFGIDLSHHQDLSLDLARCRREGISFVFLKATEGSTFVDPEFRANLAEARRAGLLVAAYHYVRGNAIASAQAINIIRTVPMDVPIILDVEEGSGDIGLARRLISDLRGSGYRVPLLYLPRWYWQQIGSPSLAGLPPLWSSRYPDTTVGTISDEWADVPAHYWDGYGGLPVQVLQFTSSARIAGHQPIDANAYRGTAAQLAALLGGEEDDMDLADRLPPIKLADGKEYSLTVGDVLSGMAQYIGGEGTPQGPQTAHPQGQYNSRVLSLAGIDANVQAISGALGEQEARILAAIQADTADQIDVPGLAAALAARVGVDLSVELAAELDRRARDGDPATGPVS